MCNVCVAGAALAVTSCGTKNCPAFKDGHRISWSNGPNIPVSTGRLPKIKGKRAWRPPPPRRPTVYVRARGRDAEGRGTFQLRRDGDPWPETWQTTDDLAGAMAMYGLDIKWGRHIPEPVQQWATYKTENMPTLDALHELQRERIERRDARRPLRSLPPRRRIRRGTPRTKRPTSPLAQTTRGKRHRLRKRG